MIKLGHTTVDEREIAGIYPGSPTEKKVWVVLKSGRGFYAIATMQEADAALNAAGVTVQDGSKSAMERVMLEGLLRQGYYFLARDEGGELWAFEAEPERGVSTWSADAGRCVLIRGDFFDGVIEWQDDLALEIAPLLEDMRLRPEQYED